MKDVRQPYQNGRRVKPLRHIEDLPTYDVIAKQRGALAEELHTLAFWVENELPALRRYMGLSASEHTLSTRAAKARQAIEDNGGRKPCR